MILISLMDLHLDNVNLKNLFQRDDKSFIVNFIIQNKKEKNAYN